MSVSSISQPYPHETAKNRILYGSAASGFDGSSLYTINTTTGAATLIGAIVPGNFGVAGLAFDPISGVLYGVGEEYVGITFVGRLLSIDIATGAGTSIATTTAAGCVPFASHLGGLSFAPGTSDLYAVSRVPCNGGAGAGELYTLSTANGALTSIGTIQTGGNIFDIQFVESASAVPELNSLLCCFVGLTILASRQSFRRRK